ncbi:MAG: C39 family peptidase [bacterium]|nr:C39 family peptidase [bacterium]
MEKEKKKSILKKAIVIVSILALLLLVFFGSGLYMRLFTPNNYMIKAENTIDYQPHYECSGYSSAYVLRSLGKKADGMEVYEQISNKNPDGTVPVETLVTFLREQGYKATEKSGTVWNLKNEVSKGVPVIVFVRTYPDAANYHYLPIVGYDEEYFYAADSLSNMKNADEQYYNRKISIADFENMWTTGITKDNTYIIMRLK